MIAHECPSCKWKLAYVGFTAVECANQQCAFYNERWYRELCDQWLNGKFDWPGYGVRTPGVVTKLELELLPQPTATPEIWTPNHDIVEPFFDTRLASNHGPLSLTSFNNFLKSIYTEERVTRYLFPPMWEGLVLFERNTS